MFTNQNGWPLQFVKPHAAESLLGPVALEKDDRSCQHDAWLSKGRVSVGAYVSGVHDSHSAQEVEAKQYVRTTH